MNGLAATVVIPTFNHGRLIEFPLACAREQTVHEIEIFVVGDGVPDVTRQIMDRVVREDPRVRFFDFPKAPGHGEVLRHHALEEARGAIVCYLEDDDLWLPNHVAAMQQLLRDADFAHTLELIVETDGTLRGRDKDLSLPAYRQRLLDDEAASGSPLSFVGHTLEAYRRWPCQWQITPPGVPNDRFMWRKFLMQPDCRAASGVCPTALWFPAPDRKGWTLAQRADELQAWQSRLMDRAEREPFLLAALEAVARGAALRAAKLYDKIVRLEEKRYRLEQRLRSAES